MNSIVHVLLGQGDYHPMTNTFHGGEQVPIQGIVILKLETTIKRKPENFPSIVKIFESATNGQQG